MASWNSAPMAILYQSFGWVAFFSWSLSFYPQVILNYKRKSVVGLNFDFVVLNFTKHTSYLIYNAALFFSPIVQKQYRENYGLNELIPVAASDVAFSIHAVLVIAFTLFQVIIYDRGTQRVSNTCIGIVSVACTAVFICLIISIPNHSWLWLTSMFRGFLACNLVEFAKPLQHPILSYLTMVFCSTLQVIMTAIKYTPQVFMNYKHKSTIGWSIGTIMLDLVGGILTFAQMGVQALDQGTWVNFYGNVGKALLSLETVVFDFLFIIQHYVLYPEKDGEINKRIMQDTVEPLIKPAANSAGNNA